MRCGLRKWGRGAGGRALRARVARGESPTCVRPEPSFSSAVCTAASVAESSALVASSRRTIGGFLRRQRAIATRCFSPPLSRSPRSPTTVSHFCSRPSTISSTCRARGGVSARWGSGAPRRAFSLSAPPHLRARRRRLELGAARARPAVRDVVLDRRVEQHGVLGHDADRAAERRLRHQLGVLAVDEHAPRVRLVEPEEQPADRRLAGAARPDDRRRRPRRHHEREPAQPLRRRARVRELDVGKLEPRAVRSVGEAERRRARRVGDVGRDEEERREVVHVDERLDHLYGEVSGQVMGGERRECATREFVCPLRITAE